MRRSLTSRAMMLGLIVSICTTVRFAQTDSKRQNSQTTDYPTTPARIKVSSEVAQKLLRKWAPPKFPPEAYREHLSGTVVVVLRIDKDGNVSKVALISQPSPVTQPVMDAVKQWKYKPYRINGEPVEVETEVKVNFDVGRH